MVATCFTLGRRPFGCGNGLESGQAGSNGLGLGTGFGFAGAGSVAGLGSVVGVSGMVVLKFWRCQIMGLAEAIGNFFDGQCPFANGSTGSVSRLTEISQRAQQRFELRVRRGNESWAAEVEGLTV